LDWIIVELRTDKLGVLMLGQLHPLNKPHSDEKWNDIF